MINLLISLLILVVLIYVVKLVVDQLPLPPPVKQIALLIIGLLGLVWLLGAFGYVDYSWPGVHRVP